MTERTTTTVRVGAATIRMQRTLREGDGALVIVVELDCRHSTTSGHYIDPDPEHRKMSDRDLALFVCAKALAETPCGCVEAVLGQYEAGGF